MNETETLREALKETLLAMAHSYHPEEEVLGYKRVAELYTLVGLEVPVHIQEKLNVTNY